MTSTPICRRIAAGLRSIVALARKRPTGRSWRDVLGVAKQVDYDLSDHIREEIARRRIPLAVVESVLENPQQKVPEHGDVICCQSKIDINQKEYLVREMVNEMLRPARVVTVYRTSKIKKYWKTTS